MDINPIYMLRALQLARNGQLDASPNPMVGAVIVSPDGTVISEGWHRRWGESHAEVNAVASVADPTLLHTATMYVTLEPCSHWGKTPPCASLIIDNGIPRVVVGCLDPYEKVSGRGVAMLRQAGVEVVTGCLGQECRNLNARFMTAHSQRRPWVTLKWAQSADGYMDGTISTRLGSMAVHRLRAMHDAILVGSGTWLADSPRLDTRLYPGRSPQRVVLDRTGRTGIGSGSTGPIVLRCASVAETLRTLYSQGITSVLVEGGAQVLGSFIESGLWDAARIERSATPLPGAHVKAPVLPLEPQMKVVQQRLATHTILHISR